MANFAAQEDTLLAGVAQTFNFKQKLGVNATSLVYSNDDASSTHSLKIDSMSFTVKPGEERVLSGVENWEVLTIGGNAGSTGAYRCYATSSDVPATIIKPQGGPITTSALADASVTDAKLAVGAHVSSGGALSTPFPVETLVLDVADGTNATLDYTALVGKHEILDVVVALTGSGNGSTYKLMTAAGAADITDTITVGAATSGIVVRAGVIKNNVLASGAGLRLATVKAGTSNAARIILTLMKVA